MRPARATAAEAPVLAAIHATAFPQPWSAPDIAAMLARSEAAAFAAAEAGFIMMRTIAGETEVLTLAVRPEQRRKGHARALVEAGLAWAFDRGATAAFLEVAADNPGAIALYEGLGFAQVGRRRAYYSRPGGAMDALVLRRDLNTPDGSAYVAPG
jgi:ribosomal-protein-alanine N-acetyltransferase